MRWRIRKEYGRLWMVETLISERLEKFYFTSWEDAVHVLDMYMIYMGRPRW